MVSVPEGCLLIQAGKQLEYLTGGYIKAGFHEVVVSSKTVEAINEKIKMEQSLWRVSSTFFSHAASDQILEPLGKYALEPTALQYEPIEAGEQVRNELKEIALGKG
mmetsp:Transcript_19025/g.28070  ORF Transcript_19025/g.28070 Transcript_19025/m.28070 type:complete len:106 (-) Transcript_19025:57-374(-)